MRQSTLTKVLMTTALIAISLTFLESEGCGRRFTRIGTIAFSPDGMAIAVAKYDARDAGTPGKSYLANISRTVSLLDAEDGGTTLVVERQVRRGNCGPALELFQNVQRSLEFYGDDFLLIQDFQGCAIKFYQMTARGSTDRLEIHVGNFALSKDQRLLVWGRYDQVSVCELPERNRVLTFTVGHLPSRQSPALAVSDDNTLVATASGSGVLVNDIATRKTIRKIGNTGGNMVVDVAFTPGKHQLAVASTDSLRVADLRDHDNCQTVLTGGVRCMAVSPDGAFLAKANEGYGVQIYETASGRRIDCFPNGRVTSLSFSWNGKLLAVGGDDGCVGMIDSTTGTAIWSVSPPGRSRPPWTFPAAMLVMWAWIYHRLWWKRSTGS